MLYSNLEGGQILEVSNWKLVMSSKNKLYPGREFLASIKLNPSANVHLVKLRGTNFANLCMCLVLCHLNLSFPSYFISWIFIFFLFYLWHLLHVSITSFHIDMHVHITYVNAYNLIYFAHI